MPVIKLVCFDMDDTLINQNSWYKLNVALGVTAAEDQGMYDSYGKGDLSYSDWLDKLVELYQKRGLANRKNVTAALSEYAFKDGAEDLLHHLQTKHYQLALISGSFNILVDSVADALGIIHRKANTTISFDKADNLLEVNSEGDELHAKLRHLEIFCKELNIDITECVCIGDGANDVEMFKRTGKGITFLDAPDHVKDVAWKVVSGLSEIKKLL